MRHHEFSCCVMAWAPPHEPSRKRWIDVLWPCAEPPSPDHAPGGSINSIFRVNMRVGFLGRCLKTVRVEGCVILSHGPSTGESNDGGRSSHLFPSPGNESFCESFCGDPSTPWMGNRLESSHVQLLKAHMSTERLKLQWLCSFCIGRHMYTQQEDTWREHLQCENPEWEAERMVITWATGHGQWLWWGEEPSMHLHGTWERAVSTGNGSYSRLPAVVGCWAGLPLG